MLPTIVRPPEAAEDIDTGVRLARMYGKKITPAQVARTLREAGVNYVIVGAHAANGYTGRPRTTIDVDVVVQFPQKAAKAIAAAFPNLSVQDTPVVIRFMAGKDEVIDLMKPTSSKLWRRLLKETREVSTKGGSIRIPTLEGILAAKFCAMVSPYRRHGDKLIDGGDFVRMIEANAAINEHLLSDLGELVYSGGGKEILKLVTDARAGRRLEF
jgi:Trk K+ transport system NAD-binding subunit